jgi:hypothetical protein
MFILNKKLGMCLYHIFRWQEKLNMLMVVNKAYKNVTKIKVFENDDEK